MANDGPVVLCRVKFTECLPFVVGQDADVAIHNQTSRLISLPAVGQGKLGSDQGWLGKFSRLVVWVAALAD